MLQTTIKCNFEFTKNLLKMKYILVIRNSIMSQANFIKIKSEPRKFQSLHFKHNNQFAFNKNLP